MALYILVSDRRELNDVLPQCYHVAVHCRDNSQLDTITSVIRARFLSRSPRQVSHCSFSVLQRIGGWVVKTVQLARSCSRLSGGSSKQISVASVSTTRITAPATEIPATFTVTVTRTSHVKQRRWLSQHRLPPTRMAECIRLTCGVSYDRFVSFVHWTVLSLTRVSAVSGPALVDYVFSGINIGPYADHPRRRYQRVTGQRPSP